MQRIIVFCILNILFFNVCAQKKILTLQEVIKEAQLLSTASKIAQSIKDNKAYIYQSYRAGLKPQLSLVGNLINFSKDYFGVVQPNGNLIFQPRSQNYSNMSLSLSQQIGPTGGTLSINSNLTRFDDFTRNEKRYNGIPLNLSLNQPLFGFNSYKWDKKIEPLKYQESEKEYLRTEADISIKASKLFFDIFDAQADIALAKKNIENQQQILSIENKRINLGTTSREKLLQINLQLLKSNQELSKSEVTLRNALFNLKSFTGQQISNNIELLLPESTPSINITVEKAVAAAKKNRSEFISYLRRKLEAEKDLQLSKKERYQINLITSYGYNNVGNEFSSVYQSPNSQKTISVGIQMPILDWGRSKGKISIAESNLKTVNFSVEQEENNLVQEVTYLTDNLILISENIVFAKKAKEISQESYDILNEQFRFGKVSLLELNLSLLEKDQANRTYIKSIRDFWELYYQLKSLTLTNLD